MEERSVLTIATGKDAYVAMAINLARSFFWWHRASDIRFFIATDLSISIPRELKRIEIIRLRPGELGKGFSPKLHLDKLAPTSETLFVDADCLCVGNLRPVFEKFTSHEVSVIGREERDGELFGDIKVRCQAVGITAVPRFCGGLYFLRRGALCSRVFDRARELEKRYDELKMVRLRGVPNEEPLIGLAMGLYNQHPIPEDGTVKAEPMFFSGKTEIDVFAGTARLTNIEGKPKPYPDWNMPVEAHPLIVHFNCTYAEKPPYISEVCRLERVMHGGWPKTLATVYALLLHRLPFSVIQGAKDLMRPLYSALFGTRRIKPSKRV